MFNGMLAGAGHLGSIDAASASSTACETTRGHGCGE
jgi:hypothetical protein